MHLKRQGLTWFARLNIPKDRWGDVGRAFRTPSGLKREHQRPLETRDLREARKRRAKALEALAAEVDEKLKAIGLPPLSGGWEPSWQDAALAVRAELAAASDDPRYGSEGEELPSERDEKRSHAFDQVEEVEAKHGQKAARQFLDIALGDGLSVRTVADRWLKDITSSVRPSYIAHHQRALGYMAAFLAERTRGDADAVLAATSISQVNRRLAGEFVEWLQDGRNPTTAANLVSAFSSLWKWAERRGLTEGNPWSGQTAGLKRKAEALKTEETDERPYRDAEVVALLKANPDEGRLDLRCRDLRLAAAGVADRGPTERTRFPSPLRHSPRMRRHQRSG